ncbi:MAG TPA: DUF2062 domain-containing protein [Chromatiaceae bacterium]|jgi:uncharacterized protein (DUF2062 family)|nr:DUF2062 domain-containing protein [Chromatiaceae bacterium]HIB83731.1 DUF2062 domain-containing protein [Chromatiaceae bacterium]HIN81871.1 DUF2062 domain-containing protein [Chromatiales bacterium]HIO14059.1 DUF2062 domain-containing protein [Chromatiales bacterium]HIO54227.1 DUF2062 domain-containing protein [Chromatiales bacterium]
MPKKLLKRYLPTRHTLQKHQFLQHFGERLHDPNLWHLNRRSVAGACAVGLFIAFVPVPFQMVLAAAVAIALRINLPMSVALVWVSNPITIPFLGYFTYEIGSWALQMEPLFDRFTLDTISERILDIWQPLLLGCFIVGTSLAVTGYFTVGLFWRLHVIRAWKARCAKRAQAKIK